MREVLSILIHCVNIWHHSIQDYYIVLKNIKSKIISLIENNTALSTHVFATSILDKSQNALDSGTHIDFYAIDAEVQIKRMTGSIQEYIVAMTTLSGLVKTLPMLQSDAEELETRIKAIITQLELKQKRLDILTRKIPQGIMDVKRALYFVYSKVMSTSEQEQADLKREFVSLHDYMRGLNSQYIDLIAQGGNARSFLIKMTGFYWEQLSMHAQKLNDLFLYMGRCSQLTLDGQFVKACLRQSIAKIPPQNTIQAALGSINHLTQKNFIKTMNRIGISSSTGRNACYALSQKGSCFFYMPSSDERYHVDYVPAEDLADTGGNCFGESLMFIHELHLGKMKHFCPEPMLLNFQLDQSRTLKTPKEYLGEAETPVSAESEFKSLQWRDMRDLLLMNPDFKPGDLCGMSFSMNDYTKSIRDFSLGHIAVIAKLDSSLCPYRYIVFEKNFGAFGVVDEDDLKYLIYDQLMPSYGGMNYSKLKLTKFAEATEATYQLLNRIKPLSAHESVVNHQYSQSFFPVAVGESVGKDSAVTTVANSV